MRLFLLLISLQVVLGFGKPVDLKCDFRTNPMAVSADQVSFFWKNDVDNQKAYQIVVSDRPDFSEGALVWKSEVEQTSVSVQVKYAGKELQPRTKYFWKVKVLNEADVWSWSEVNSFETAVEEGFWAGVDWISCDRDAAEAEVAPEGWLGEWISTNSVEVKKEKGKDQKVKGIEFSFDLPDKQVVYAGTYFSASKANDSLEIMMNGEASKYVTHFQKKYVDFAFLLKPNAENTIKVNFRKPSADQAVALGMKVIFADGTTQWVRSNKEWTSVVGKKSSVTVRNELNSIPQAVYPRKKLPATWYKKSFQVKQSVSSARLYYCGVGYAESYLNGDQFSEHGMETGQSDYEAFAYYQTKDVTKSVKEGENTLSYLVADGWYNQDSGFCTTRFIYGKPALISKLVIVYEDGTKETISSDQSWKFAESKIQYSNIYLGEKVDFRKAREDALSAELGSDWKSATKVAAVTPKLVFQDFEPVKKIREIEPKAVWQVGKETWLVDFGRNFAGGVNLKFQEASGKEIRIRVSEFADKSAKQIKNVPQSFWNCNGEPQNHFLIADGKAHTWEPQFTYHGFQYAEISGVTSKPEILGVEIYSDVKQTATFRSDDAMLNRIFEMGINTHYMNMHSILEDCPHREKCQWGGDLHASWAVGYYGLDSAAFYRQQSRVYFTGQMTEGVPGNIGVGKRLSGSIDDFSWSVSPLFIAYRNYQHYGDLDTFKEHYYVMLTMLNYFAEDSDNFIPRKAKHADHAPPIPGMRPPQNKKLIAAINFYGAAKRFALLAEKIGKPRGVSFANRLAENIKSSVNSQFYNKENSTYGNATQDSLALTMGIVPESEVEKVTKGLIPYFEKNGKKFDGGFMSYNIYPWLSNAGASDLVYEIMTGTHYPGLAWSIDAYDATSYWERFQLGPQQKDPNDPTKNGQVEKVSRAHHAMNHPSAWLVNELAGIKNSAEYNAMQSIVLEPRFISQVNEVESSVETLYGVVKSEWKRVGGKVSWKFTVPANTTALVKLPNQKEKVFTSGDHQLSID